MMPYTTLPIQFKPVFIIQLFYNSVPIQQEIQVDIQNVNVLGGCPTKIVLRTKLFINGCGTFLTAQHLFNTMSKVIQLDQNVIIYLLTN